jgi:hypothetical protein
MLTASVWQRLCWVSVPLLCLWLAVIWALS